VASSLGVGLEIGVLGIAKRSCCYVTGISLYICANPFIYATKFEPMRRILGALGLTKMVLHRLMTQDPLVCSTINP